MAWAHIASGTYADGAASSGISVPYPSGGGSGNLLVVVTYCRTSSDQVALPGGWTSFAVGNSGQTRIFGKVADGTETGSLAVSGAGTPSSDRMFGCMARFSGGPASLGSIVHNSNYYSLADEDCTVPSLTITENDTLVITGGGKQVNVGANTYTPPTGFTEIDQGNNTAGNGSSIVMGYQIQTTATNITQSTKNTGTCWNTSDLSTASARTLIVSLVKGSGGATGLTLSWQDGSADGIALEWQGDQ